MKIYIALITLIALALPLGCPITLEELNNRAILRESNKKQLDDKMNKINQEIKQIQQNIHDLEQGYFLGMPQKDKDALNNEIEEQELILKQKKGEKQAAEKNITEEEQKVKDEKEAAKRAIFEQRNIDRRNRKPI